MEIKKPDRATLKSYFVKNAMPTASNFADLIEGLINQRDDGLAKPAGEPLSLQAEGDDTSQKKAINFYRSFADAKPAWALSLNPRADPAKPDTARPGWSIADADGASRLFIDQSTGNVGIGTVTGGYKLNVQGAVQVVHQNQDANYGALFLGPGDKSNLRLGYHADYSWIQSHGAKPLAINPLGNNVGIGTDKPRAALEVKGGAIMPSAGNAATAGIQFPPDPGGGSGDAAWIRYYPRQGESCTLELGTSNDADDHIALMPSGNVGIGTTDPKAKLDVNGKLQVQGDLRVQGHLIRKVYVATGLGPGDATSNGQIVTRVLTFTKLYDDSAIRILYCDNLRVAGGNSSARWEIRIDGKSAPGGAIYQDKYGEPGNHHDPTTIMGYATGVKAGSHTIGIWVNGTAYPGHRLDPYTGWLNSRWTLEAQEVWI